MTEPKGFAGSGRRVQTGSVLPGTRMPRTLHPWGPVSPGDGRSRPHFALQM